MTSRPETTKIHIIFLHNKTPWCVIVYNKSTPCTCLVPKFPLSSPAHSSKDRCKRPNISPSPNIRDMSGLIYVGPNVSPGYVWATHHFSCYTDTISGKKIRFLCTMDLWNKNKQALSWGCWTDKRFTIAEAWKWVLKKLLKFSSTILFWSHHLQRPHYKPMRVLQSGSSVQKGESLSYHGVIKSFVSFQALFYADKLYILSTRTNRKL